MAVQAATLSLDEAQALAEGRHGDPFSVLGLHSVEGRLVVRALRPEVDAVEVLDAKTGRRLASLSRFEGTDGLFEGVIPRRKNRFAYLLRLTQGEHVWEQRDPFSFGPVLGEMDEYLLAEGDRKSVV